MIVLGIETSCDETCSAVLEYDKNHQCNVLSNTIYSQISEHKDYGGVVPEIAARSHINNIDVVVQKSVKEAEINYNSLDAIAVTSGPGLKGGLLVGVTFAKTMASILEKPLIGINHLEGHALTVRMAQKINFPYLLLLVTGGHTQLLIVKGVGDYKRLGTTIDDALGEAYDKTAKSLNLGYPGGPIIEKLAKVGNGSTISFPRPLYNSKEMNFSFSGLKTAVKQEIDNSLPLNEKLRSNICAAFQDSVIDILENKLQIAVEYFKKNYSKNIEVVLAGGVASNKAIFSAINKMSKKKNFNVHVSPKELCTDNAAMIAWAGIERMNSGNFHQESVTIRTRWPLDENASKVRGAGVKA